MKVIALKQGYYGKLRAPGDEFEVPDGAKGSWFTPAEKANLAKPEKKPGQDKKAESDLV